MHIALFIKVIYWIRILLEKKYFILFSLQSYFFDEQSKCLILQFYWNKKLKHRFKTIQRSILKEKKIEMALETDECFSCLLSKK